MKKIRIEKTSNDIPIILRSTEPFDELGLALSNVLHEYDVANMGLTFEEVSQSLAFLTKDEPTRKDIDKAYEKTREALKRILDK